MLVRRAPAWAGSTFSPPGGISLRVRVHHRFGTGLRALHIRSYWGAGPRPDFGTAEAVMIEKADPQPKGARAGGRQAMEDQLEDQSPLK